MYNQLRTVPPEGRKDAPIAIIGEAPGKAENRAGRPFVGPAGGVLEECIHGASIIRSDLYLTNFSKQMIVKPNKDTIKTAEGITIWTYKNGLTELGRLMRDELVAELSSIGARVLVPMGNLAMNALIGKNGIYKYRGSIYHHESTGKKVIPTIHPAASLYGGEYIVRYYIIYDLRRAVEEMKTDEIGVPKQSFMIRPTFYEAEQVLSSLITLGRNGTRINYDIEILNGEVSCISFTDSLKWAICIAFKEYTIDEEIKLWDLIATLMEDPTITKVNQNIAFDYTTTFMRNKIGMNGRLDDPMIGHSILYPDFPKGLDFLTSIYTKVPYYKDDGKVWFKGIATESIDQFYTYSCQDSSTSIEAMNKIDEDLDRYKQFRGTYEETIKLLYPLGYMMIRGVKVNKEEFAKVKKDLEDSIEDNQKKLNEMTKRDFNVKSTQHKIKYFYVEKNITPYLKKGKPTTDAKAIARLAKGTATRDPMPEA